MKETIPKWQTKPLYTRTDLNNDPPKIANPQDWPMQDLLRCIWNKKNNRAGYVMALVVRVVEASRSPNKTASLLHEVNVIGTYLDAEIRTAEIKADESEQRDKRRKKKKKSKK